MDESRIAELLQPFLGTELSASQLHDISMYIDLLLRWNARVNLTAVRAPEEIVTRHFGESLFAARHLYNDKDSSARGLIDLGSGAGFPGLPAKIFAPHSRVTLIESSHKKSAFLREVIRSLKLMDIDVFCGRGETFSGTAGAVTLRAVERFENALSVAAGLLTPGGRVALLIGVSQAETARGTLPSFVWEEPLPIPLSSNRILLIGEKC